MCAKRFTRFSFFVVHAEDNKIFNICAQGSPLASTISGPSNQGLTPQTSALQMAARILFYTFITQSL